MTQDEHLAAAILNEIYDARISERVDVLARWVDQIRKRSLEQASLDDLEAEYTKRAAGA